MKTRGMTLVELLVVVAILGLLAALLLPAVARLKTRTKVERARIEMNQLVMAISDYQSSYGQFPVSDEGKSVATALREDVTYGGVIEETGAWIAGPAPYLTNNAEVIAPLLDLECYGDGAPTINRGHVKNPRSNKFLEAAMVGGTNVAPGIGVDGIYRDPWGGPYVVTLDLNGDGRARDFFYRSPAVSEDARNPGHGLNGLVRSLDSEGNVVYEAPVPVMVWSAGPDRHLDTRLKANQGVNRDNLLSWTR